MALLDRTLRLQPDDSIICSLYSLWPETLGVSGCHTKCSGAFERHLYYWCRDDAAVAHPSGLFLQDHIARKFSYQQRIVQFMLTSISMSLTRTVKKEDLLRNLGTFSGTLSFNDGCVGALFPDRQFFITSPTSNFIPSPPTTKEVHLYTDGRFREHDYSHVPQYYEEAYCHLPLIPRQPTGLLNSHPYLDYTYMWENAVLDRLAHVAVDIFTIQVLVATMQQFWLEIIAALDYMDWVKPVMDGIKPLDPARKAEHCIGMFTWDVGAAQLFFKAQIPVFFIRPWESFSNQVVLCVVKLSPTGTCTAPPACPFPIVFDGPPSDPKKYVGHPKNKKITNNIGQEKFADLRGDYAPVVIAAWSNALSSINEESASPNPVATTYMFPNPIIITNANAVRQKAYLRQLDHSFDALKYHATAMASEASPLCPQQWRDLLALNLKCADGPSSSKSKNSPSVKGFKAVEAMLGSWMHAQGVQVQLVPPPSSDDQPFDVHHGQQLVWELCELNFCYELLALDNRVAQEPATPLAVSATTSAINDFTSDRQNAVLAIFPGGSLIPSAGEGLDDGFGGEWTRRRERLRNLRELMRGWVVPLPLACHGLLGMMESEGTAKVEKALAAHYVQTFFDFFGRPPVVPYRKP
ncbi:hypothetical protein ARMSODRAFT_1062043 [Armillaria solidipes]|uniref:Uncharacterized protein n=1 Tax=Armillaria solidipes TaxID=1076256 RepID=A0A2H3BG31_9AGAR|nr:hypothetical protein ARMSODRAFT_1062043 [Armillaria solidipes]